jgi:hypothetical protein
MESAAATCGALHSVSPDELGGRQAPECHVGVSLIVSCCAKALIPNSPQQHIVFIDPSAYSPDVPALLQLLDIHRAYADFVHDKAAAEVLKEAGLVHDITGCCDITLVPVLVAICR